MAAHEAPPSLGFSRQEHWSGLPFPSPMHESEKWKWSHSVVSESSWPHGLQPTRLLRPWDFPGKSTGVSCHFLLQGIFLSQGSNQQWNLNLVPFYSKTYCLFTKAMATHSSTLAWKIPWTEGPGGLPSMGSHRVRHDWSDLAAAAAATLEFQRPEWGLQPWAPPSLSFLFTSCKVKERRSQEEWEKELILVEFLIFQVARCFIYVA